MKILLTNDDGYEAEGLIFLKKYFNGKGHEVFIAAPDSEKSGCSHGVTIKDPIRLVKQFDNVWVFRATPADCVFTALNGIGLTGVDVVVSGINHGRNAGKDVFFSGTIGAARQGAFAGIVSFALSFDINTNPFQFETACSFLDSHFDTLVNKGQGGDFFYNINFPNIKKSEIAGIKITSPSHDYEFEQTMEKYHSPFQGTYFFVSGKEISYTEDPETDIWAIRNNFISITPLKLLPGTVEDFSL